MAAAPVRAAVDFQKEVAPVIAEYCLKCHGPDKSKGGLNLTTLEGATKLLKSGSTAVVPSHPDKSGIVARLASPDPDEQMPPPD